MRPTRRQQFAAWWADAPGIIRFGIVLAAVIVLACLIPGCALQHVRPFAEVKLKSEVDRAFDPRWGIVQRVEIGVRADF